MDQYPFRKPVPLKRLGEETGQSYYSIRRLVKAGIATTVAFPNETRIRPRWGNRYVREGLTPQELRKLSRYNRTEKEKRVVA